jgi:hypothetical protein
MGVKDGTLFFKEGENADLKLERVVR